MLCCAATDTTPGPQESFLQENPNYAQQPGAPKAPQQVVALCGDTPLRYVSVIAFPNAWWLG